MKGRSSFKLLFLSLFLLTTFLSFNKHSHDRSGTYHGVVWADAAGYYVHGPIWFIYGNDPGNLPKGIAERTGNGFHIDSLKKKIITKYSCGVAILQSPFFLTAHLLSKSFGYEADGFSEIYSYFLYVAGAFYVCVGMMLISLFLEKHFNKLISIATPLLLFSTTNLFYYSVDAPGMSHVYSFFLCALFLYSTQRIIFAPKAFYYVAFVATATLLIVIRPTNAVMLLFPLFYENAALLKEFNFRKNIKVFIASVILAFLLVIPQLLYLHSSYGRFFSYSYTNETFSNWQHPHILETWFSPNNGLFIYSPVFIFIICGVILMILKRDALGWMTGILFLLISYIFSSWWCWWFGCSLGARSFVEFYVIFSIPLAWLIRELWKRKFTRYLFIGISLLFCFIYFNIEYYYDGCFYGGTWDWQSYLKLLEL